MRTAAAIILTASVGFGVRDDSVEYPSDVDVEVMAVGRVDPETVSIKAGISEISEISMAMVAANAAVGIAQSSPAAQIAVATETSAVQGSETSDSAMPHSHESRIEGGPAQA